MTGKDAQKDRRAVHFTIEMNRSTRHANLLAFPVALLALGVAIVVIRLLPLIPLWASVLPAAVAYAAVLFVTLARQRRGLRLAQWRAFVDRKRARTGEIGRASGRAGGERRGGRVGRERRSQRSR